MHLTRSFPSLVALPLLISAARPLAAQPAQTTPQSAPRAQVHVATGDARSYYTNAWWIESAEGLVLIDAMCLRSDVVKLIAAMRSTGKPLVAAYITHPHADHFGGIAELKAAYPGAQIIATSATAGGMQSVHDAALKPGGWLDALGAEYERTLRKPDRIVASGTTLTLAGLTFTIRDYGPAEAENNSVIHLHELNALFTGDLTVSGGAYFVGEKQSRLAMIALAALRTDFPTVQLAYSGHFAPMPLRAVIDENIEQLRFLRLTAAAEFADSGSRSPTTGLTDDARRRLVRTFAGHARERNSYGLGAVGMAQMNAAGIIDELRTDSVPNRVRPVHDKLRAGMRSLRFLLGRWDGTQFPADSTIAPAPRAINIGAEFVPVLGGAAYEGRMTAPGYRFVLTLSYDVAQQKYRVAALDDVSGLLDIFEGGLGGDGALTVDNLRTGTFYLNARGAHVNSRLRFAPTAGGLFRLDVHDSVDGGRTWTPSTRYDATRRVLP